MAIKEMSVWKWILLFIAALFLSLLLYGFSSLTTLISIDWLRWVCTLVVAAAMLGLYSLFVHWFEGHWAKDLPLGKCLPQTAAGLGVGLGYFVIVVAIMMAFGVYKVAGTGNQWMDIASSFFVFLLVAIGEEVIFRGVFFRWIDEKWGFIAALIVSAVFFGLIHIFQENATLWSSLAIAIEAGLLLAAAYKYSGTLWLPIGIHWAWNFTQGNIFGFGVSGSDAGDSLFQSSVSGPEWLTGGAFGAEASVIPVMLGLLLSAWYVWGIVKRLKG